MNVNALFEAIPPGCGGRWALGSVVLIFLIVYNESCGPTAVFSTLLAMFYGLISAICKSSLRNLQMPYIRATNKFDFTCLFLATWMDALAILTACGALARTLSSCLDAMTGGLARIFILGRNSPTNEPWPDVLGVSVVLVVTGMFMLGLENTGAFSAVMSVGMLGLNVVISVVSWSNGDTKEWDLNYFQPNGLSSFLTAAALGTFIYPGELPHRPPGWRKYLGLVLIAIISISIILGATCLTSIVHFKPNHDYIAVPLFTILEENSFHKLVPAAACLLMFATSGSFLELFPELYNIIVRMATSEWKIFSKQISYESADSGNPVLAIFIAGSLCGMLAFACPLEHLTHILAASHLCGGLFRAIYLLYSPFRPKYIQQTCSDSSLSYSRLSSVKLNQNPSSHRRRSLWNINLPIQGSLKSAKSKSKSKCKREVEKEWLLLGEPSSPLPAQRDSRDVESTILSDGEPPASDFEYPDKCDNSDSDISTDIDAIVDEYRQKVKVTTAGPMEKSIRVPSVASWRVTLFAIFLIVFGIVLTVLGIRLYLPPAYITGLIGIFLISVMMSFIPRYTGSGAHLSPVLCTISLTLGTLLLSACLDISWPAILVWILAGLVLVMRCDNWCCSCFEQTTMDEQLIPNISAKTTIRIPRPPKGIMIPGRIQASR